MQTDCHMLKVLFIIQALHICVLMRESITFMFCMFIIIFYFKQFCFVFQFYLILCVYML